MRVISVDIGNGGLRFRAEPTGEEFPNRKVGGVVSMRDNDFAAMFDQMSKWLDVGQPCRWVASSVNHSRQQQLVDWLDQNRPEDRFELVSLDQIPLEINVDFPEQVGKDRLLAAVGAIDLARETGLSTSTRRSPLIVIDSGTAVTVDLLDGQHCFQGGYIFPGIESAFAQLASGTNALPDLGHAARIERILHESKLDQPRGDELQFGKNTVDAIMKGIYQSQWGAIQYLAGQLRDTRPVSEPVSECQSTVVLTGGGIDELRLCRQAGWLGWDVDACEAWPPGWIECSDLVLRGVSIVAQQPASKRLGDHGW